MIAAQTRQNNAKLGFYPTDSETLKIIKSSLEFQDSVTMLDPCAGEGVALHYLGYGHKKIGIELEEQRYMEARSLLDTCIHADALMQIKFTPYALDFLFLNPPYGESATHKRLEYAFVKKYSQSLAVGGLMVLIIPSTQVNQEFLKYVMSNFTLERAGKAPEQRFNQWIFIGRKVKRRNPVKADVDEVLETINQQFIDPVLRIKCRHLNGKFSVTTSKVTQQQITYALTGRSSLWDGYFDSQIVSKNTKYEQPLTELNEWFITMGILGGHISGVLDNGEKKLLLRGKVHKEFGKAVYGYNDNESDYVQTEIFVPKILALNIDEASEEFGEIYEIK